MSVAAPSRPPPLPPPLPPPPPPSPNSPAQAKTTGKRSFAVSSGTAIAGQSIIVFGPGGIGKTELISLAAKVGLKPLIIDLEAGSGYLDVARIAGITTWQELRDVLHDPQVLAPFDMVAIDSFTKAEELATAHTLLTVPHEKGHAVDSIEGYGFGKGITHVYETFLTLLGDLDAIKRSGKSVVGICHDCTANAPNPFGEDWIRYEPRLQSPASGKSSIRHRVKEWCDHLLFVGYDVAIGKDGKGKGGGTRTIYPTELPSHWAKSRYLADPIPYRRGEPDLWKALFNKGE